MQAVLLVAGKSTRTYPLTLTRPKPMLPIANRTIIEHNLEQLAGLVSEVILIVGYRQEMIRSFLGHQWRDISIVYCEQTEQLGTGHAVLQVQPYIKDRFLVLNGDDIYAKNDIQKLLPFSNAALVKEVADPSQYGVYQVDAQNRVLDLVEKPKQFIGTLTNIGCYLFSPEIFHDLSHIPLSERGEYELTAAILSLAHRQDFFVCPITDFWLTNGYAWELLNSQRYFLSQLQQSEIHGEVEAGAVLKGFVHVGAGSIIKAGAYIEGPVMIGQNCQIGPNCYLRDHTCIGDHCRVGHAVEIKNSIVMDHTNICHLSYVGDSVIGSRVNLGAGFISANVRHDHGVVKSMIKGKLVATGLAKFGTIIGDAVKTGIHTSVLPGRKIWPGLMIQPGQIVSQDLMS
ncbi:NTP transferase domain-containing protein [candidate division KSB1 bacterium]|nr:NTP transferase domain-containing protein [candidate division KSB1 bacterium]